MVRKVKGRRSLGYVDIAFAYMDPVSQRLIPLPNTCKTWSAFKDNLEALEKTGGGVEALESILKRHDRWENIQLPLELVRRVLKSDDHFTAERFSDVLLPWLTRKALQINELFENFGYKLLNLRAGVSGEVDLTRQQVCCLLALAFFNAFEPVQGCYQQFTFSGLLSFSMYASQISKFKCLMYYFERIYRAEEIEDMEFLSMHITVTRKTIDLKQDGASWAECTKPLSSFQSLAKGRIEDADGYLQVDFANEYIGGGVLDMGNVQEEIRFMINPECLVSILLCEKMKDDESILITGAEQFSSYSGYGESFKCTGPYTDINAIDDRKRRCVSIVAIDATYFMSSSSLIQYTKQNILRELNKACCGFEHIIVSDDWSASKVVPVATGNWGCGAFGGNKKMKTIIQWMAASRVGRDVKYFTFDDQRLSEEQSKIIAALLGQNMTVGQLYQLIVADHSKKDVFKYLSQRSSSENR